MQNQISNPTTKLIKIVRSFKLPIFHSSNAQTNVICIHASLMISYRLDPIHGYCSKGLVINISMNYEFTVLWCCLISLWWFVLIRFACKLCEKLLQIYHHNKERVLEGWNVELNAVKCTVTRKYKIHSCGAGSPAYCNGLSGQRAGRKLI